MDESVRQKQHRSTKEDGSEGDLGCGEKVRAEVAWICET